jgi:flagellar protein FliT
MHPVIENYEYLSLLTAQMREAASQDKWDDLVELEKQCSLRVETMKALDASTPIDESTRLHKVALIRKILADDAEIRNRTEPWMAQLQRIIKGVVQERRLLETYSGN